MLFTRNVIKLIKSIPKGRVVSYGKIAFLAGNPKAARQVARILHPCSKKYHLPWHRVVNAKRKISFKNEDSISEQRILLESESIRFSSDGKIEKHFIWTPDFKKILEN